MENEDIIHLQNAHVTQYNNEGSNKTEWKVRKNITSEDLFELPGDLTEAEVFKVLEFARKYELIAFNEGIRFGKNELKRSYDSTIKQLQNNIMLAREENIRLATTLEKFIISEE